MPPTGSKPGLDRRSGYSSGWYILGCSFMQCIFFVIHMQKEIIFVTNKQATSFFIQIITIFLRTSNQHWRAVLISIIVITIKGTTNIKSNCRRPLPFFSSSSVPISPCSVWRFGEREDDDDDWWDGEIDTAAGDGCWKKICSPRWPPPCQPWPRSTSGPDSTSPQASQGCHSNICNKVLRTNSTITIIHCSHLVWR